jgi:hypothetical protein
MLFVDEKTNCATAIASSAQTATSSNKRTAPMSLRVRMVMRPFILGVIAFPARLPIAGAVRPDYRVPRSHAR